MNESKKENKVFLIGLLLIIAVIAIFFIRANMNGGKSQLADTKKEELVIEFETMNPLILSNKVSGEDEVQLIDIRSVEEYESEHILDSKNITFEDESNFSTVSLKNDKLTIVISSNGEEEPAIASYKKLKSDGFSNCFILEGGLINWKSQGFTTVSWGDPESFVNQSKIIYLEIDNLKKQIDSGGTLYILDIRPPQEYKDYHLPKAVNIPFSELESRHKELPFNKTIIIYGSTQLESFRGGVRLFDIGFQNNAVLQGGIEDWKNINYPTEK